MAWWLIFKWLPLSFWLCINLFDHWDAFYFYIRKKGLLRRGYRQVAAMMALTAGIISPVSSCHGTGCVFLWVCIRTGLHRHFDSPLNESHWGSERASGWGKCHSVAVKRNQQSLSWSADDWFSGCTGNFIMNNWVHSEQLVQSSYRTEKSHFSVFLASCLPNLS